MERFFNTPKMVSELRRGPLAPFLDEIAQELSDDGYSMSTARLQILVDSDFSRWLELESVHLRDVKRHHATAYIRSRDERRCARRKKWRLP